MDGGYDIYKDSSNIQKNIFIISIHMKHKDLILFVIITFIRSVFISMLKFFLRSYLKDIHISLEEITGYLSL